MIQIVFKPEKAPIVRGESLYRAVFNQKDTVFTVRAKNAAHAELKVLEAFKFNLTGKTIDYDVESWLQSKRENDTLPTSSEEDDTEVRPRSS